MHSVALLSLALAAVANGLAVNTQLDTSASGSTDSLMGKGPGGPPGHPSGPGGPPPKPSPHKPGSPESIAHMREKIKHVVVMVMENRSLGNLMGGLKIPGLYNHVNNGPFCNPYNVTEGPEPKYCGKAKEADSVSHDPDHSVPGNNLEFYGTYNPSNADIASGKLKPNMQGFVTKQIANFISKPNVTKESLAGEAMDYYSEDQIPVIASLAHNSLVFNNWHSDFAGPTNPNRLFLTSGHSNGHVSNDFAFYTMPQVSIWQRLSERNIDWKVYQHGTSFGDASWYSWTSTSNNTHRVVPAESFYDDVITESLPPLSFVEPDCCGVGTMSMHPEGLVSDGERFIRGVWHALRNSKYWEDTLLVITFDESGGQYDPVPPPLAPRPNSMSTDVKTPTGQNYTMQFDRLGGRIPTMLISPWVQAGVEGLGTNLDGKKVSYSATSWLHTMALFYGFEAFNDRVSQAPTFDHLIGDKLRQDVPKFLPQVKLITPGASPF